MLGLRLDEPLPLEGLEAAIDDDALRAHGARRARSWPPARAGRRPSR